jgi:hypothetical protein
LDRRPGGQGELDLLERGFWIGRPNRAEDNLLQKNRTSVKLTR